MAGDRGSGRGSWGMGSRRARGRSPRARSACLWLCASLGTSPPRCARVLPGAVAQPPAPTLAGLAGDLGALPGKGSVRPGLTASPWLLPLLPARWAPGPGRGQVLACASPSCPAPGPRFRRPGADGRRPARLPAPGRVCSDGRGSQSQGGRGKPAWALRTAPGRSTQRLTTSAPPCENPECGAQPSPRTRVPA